MLQREDRMNLAQRVAGSPPIQAMLTLVLYSLYAAVIGVCLAPAAALLLWAHRTLVLAPQLAGTGPSAGSVVLFSLLAAAALYAFFLTGVLVMGTLVRLVTAGIRPGRYPVACLTFLRWIIAGGIYAIAIRLVLPVIRLSFFCNLFYQIVGCRMGRDVKLNTWVLPDAYLLTLGDGVVVGGETEISCHLFEGDHLILDRVSIGAGTLVGARCYISPGATIGKRCVIGLGSFIRRGRVIPDGSHITSIGGIDMREARRIEHAGRSPAAKP
jgi:hypothetical protein